MPSDRHPRPLLMVLMGSLLIKACSEPNTHDHRMELISLLCLHLHHPQVRLGSIDNPQQDTDLHHHLKQDTDLHHHPKQDTDLHHHPKQDTDHHPQQDMDHLHPPKQDTDRAQQDLHHTQHHFY